MTAGNSPTRYTALLFIVGTLTFLIQACGSNQDAVTPDISLNSDRNPVAGELASGHNLWGYWNCRIPPTLDTIEFIPARAGVFHLNARRFLEDSPCTDCLKLVSLEKDFTSMEITAKIQITHPLPVSPRYIGFDVRGIIISNGSLYFPEFDARVPEASKGDFTLLNPDGWTRLWNTKEFAPGSGPFPILEYSTGKYATPGSFTGTVNPYIEFSQQPRSHFPTGASITRDFKLTLIPGGAIFGYAIDASWEPPTVNPPVDILTDFPETANAPEPWLTTVWQAEPLNDEVNDTASCVINMVERQDELLAEYVSMECPDLWNGVLESMLWISPPIEPFWHPLFAPFPIINQTGAAPGSYPAMMLVKDGYIDPNLGDVNHRYELTYLKVEHYELPAFTGKAVYLAPVIVDPSFDGIPNLFLRDMVSNVETQITDYTTMEQYIDEPRINPQGTLMLLTVSSQENEWNGSLKVINTAGLEINTITNPGGTIGDADFHPDGSQIVVTAGTMMDGNRDLFTVDFDGTGWTKLATAPGAVRYPRWSPDGSKIAMVISISSPIGGEIGLWIYDVSKDEFTKLIGGQYNIECPSWSPVKINGEDSIVYQSDQNDPGGFFVDLYTINPDTLVSELLVDDDGPINKHPSYSPDGKAVMYTRFSQSLWPNVYVYMIETKQNYQITSDSAFANTPAWSWGW